LEELVARSDEFIAQETPPSRKEPRVATLKTQGISLYYEVFVPFAMSAFVFGFRSLSCIPYGSEVWIRVGLQDQRATEARSKFFGP
jgi:hypothetical protein